MQTIRALAVIGMTAGMLVTAGCGEDSDRPEYRVIEGTIESINTDTGVVTMLFQSRKHPEPIRLEGKLALDAEIFIDGATATLDDLQIDDFVKVTGRREKRNGDLRLVATRVEVEREMRETAELAPDTQPAG